MMDLDWMLEQAMVVMKVTLACSPIIGIGLILALARESEEEESAKREAKREANSVKG